MTEAKTPIQIDIRFDKSNNAFIFFHDLRNTVYSMKDAEYMFDLDRNKFGSGVKRKEEQEAVLLEYIGRENLANPHVSHAIRARFTGPAQDYWFVPKIQEHYTDPVKTVPAALVDTVPKRGSSMLDSLREAEATLSKPEPMTAPAAQDNLSLSHSCPIFPEQLRADQSRKRAPNPAPQECRDYTPLEAEEDSEETALIEHEPDENWYRDLSTLSQPTECSTTQVTKPVDPSLITCAEFKAELIEQSECIENATFDPPVQLVQTTVQTIMDNATPFQVEAFREDARSAEEFIRNDLSPNTRRVLDVIAASEGALVRQVGMPPTMAADYEAMDREFLMPLPDKAPPRYKRPDKTPPCTPLPDKLPSLHRMPTIIGYDYAYKGTDELKPIFYNDDDRWTCDSPNHLIYWRCGELPRYPITVRKEGDLWYAHHSTPSTYNRSDGRSTPNRALLSLGFNLSVQERACIACINLEPILRLGDKYHAVTYWAERTKKVKATLANPALARGIVKNKSKVRP